MYLLAGLTGYLDEILGKNLTSLHMVVTIDHAAIARSRLRYSISKSTGTCELIQVKLGAMQNEIVWDGGEVTVGTRTHQRITRIVLFRGVFMEFRMQCFSELKRFRLAGV